MRLVESRQVQLLITCILFGCGSPSYGDSALSIISSPSGPVYPAASWVRLACKHDRHTPPHITYTWTGNCRSTGETVLTITDPFMDDQGWAVIWVQSTPLRCMDAFHCTTYYENEDETATRYLSLSEISGVGMSLSLDLFQGSVPNNSAVIVDKQNQPMDVSEHEDVGIGIPQELLCQSALLRTGTNCNARWLNPSNSPVGRCVSWSDSGISEVGETVTEQNEVLSFNSLKLELGATDLEEGVYTCVIEDENRVEQKLYVGVYQDVPKLSVELNYQATSEGLVLHCDTRGPPSTAILWFRDGVLISDVDGEFMTSSILPPTLPSGSDGRSGGGVVYRHSLKVFKGNVGMYSCDAFSKWIMADRSSSGRTGATGFFVVYPSSTIVKLECAFPQESTSEVEWLDTSPSPIPLEGVAPYTHSLANSSAVLILVVTDDMDGHVLTCRGMEQSGNAKYKQYMVITESAALVATTEDKDSDTNHEKTEKIQDFDQALLVELIAILAIFCTMSSFLLVLATILCVWRRRMGKARKKVEASPPPESKDSKEVEVGVK